MDVIENARRAAKDGAARVVFPDENDPRIVEVATRLREEGLAEPIQNTPVTQAQIEGLVARRRVRPEIARRMLERPLIQAAAMLAEGDADIMVAGASVPTRRVVEAAGLAVGLADGVETPSSFFLLHFPDGRRCILADCAVNVAPSARELAAIARETARSARLLLGRANVALLSYATGFSGTGVSAERVRAAAQETGFQGPIQADAALDPVIAARKGASGAGAANVLIFPNLDAGNIAYKLLREFAGAKAYGPFLQGYRRPICDLSRGASVEEIYHSTLLTLALAKDAPRSAASP